MDHQPIAADDCKSSQTVQTRHWRVVEAWNDDKRMDAASNLSELLFGRNPNVRSRLAADGALYACIDLLKRFVSHGRCKHRLVKQLAKEREREREREISAFNVLLNTL